MATMHFPWDWLSDMLGKFSMVINNIQFSFRFLGIASVFAMVICCIVLKSIRNINNGQYFQSALLGIGIIVFISGSYVIDTRNLGAYRLKFYDFRNNGTAYNAAEYLLEGTDINILVPNKISLGEGVELNLYNKEYTNITLTCKNSSDVVSYLEVPLLWYQQYIAKDENGKKMELVCGDNNVLRLLLPSGYQGTIKICYKQPLSWRISELISVVTLLLIIVFSVKEYKRLRIKNVTY